MALPDTVLTMVQARLEALLQTNDGFELADRDLELRGSGTAPSRTLRLRSQ